MNTYLKKSNQCIRLLLTAALFMLIAGDSIYAQWENKWLSAGSLHNWYSAVGSEREHGFQPDQQYGLRWPAIYDRQDAQAAKAFWIGARNFTDQEGRSFPVKVVHVGPRVTGAGVFYPIEFDLVSKVDPPQVFVDGDFQFGPAFTEVDAVDPTIAADRMIVNTVNTQLGLTMTRRIMQFSQQYHDNYHIAEYIFTNTGNVNDNPTIELPNTTLNDVYIFFQNRYSVLNETRHLFGNATGWGINTMIDHRGDGRAAQYNDPPDEDFRATFAWHGYYPDKTVEWNNIGGPIFRSDRPTSSRIDIADTVGRLGAANFVGVATIHADRSVTDPTDDPGQPSTMRHFGSDEPETSANDPFNPVRMDREYNIMTAGRLPRHAFEVHPGGDFENQTAAPALGSPGGFSNTFGYGPYTIPPGESIRIVIVEAASGLSRENAIRIGRPYKASGGDDNLLINIDGVSLTKNQWAMTSRDSLFQTFRRAIANYESGFNIPRPPLPPNSFNVDSGGDRITLSWDVYAEAGPTVTGFEIYRATGRSDSTYYLIHTAGPGERSFDDTTPIRGQSYYYYIVSVGDPAQNDGTGLTPSGTLRSSRYYTQTYDPAFLRRPAGRPIERGDNTIDVTAVLDDGENTIEFEFADNMDGRADGFAITDFYLTLRKWRIEENGDTTVLSVDTQEIPPEDLPLRFYNRSVGSRETVIMEFDLEDETVFYDAYYHIATVDVFDLRMIRMYINNIEVPLPESIVSPYKSRMDAIRIVPNPYYIDAARNVRFDERDRIAFFNIPGQATIRIYTELGELIRTIEHTDGSGDEFWDLTTSSRQVVVSGIYIAVIDDNETGDRAIRKFVIIR
jgi:hypothetical protein